MNIKLIPGIAAGKLLSFASRLAGFGYGSTWPGHLALNADKNFIRDLIDNNPKLKIILVAGTNGKTTSSKLLQFILEKNGITTFHNESGANLLNGVASSLIKNSSVFGKLNFEVAIFETDENALPNLLKIIKRPHSLVILNLFRDQLDRYGEVNQIANKWEDALSLLPKNTTVFVNGDDPKLSFMGKKLANKTYYFGIGNDFMQKRALSHDTDFSYCPNCATKLEFKKIAYSHLGQFICPNCKFENPKTIIIPDLPYKMLGTYNIYNINAASLVASILGVKNETIREALDKFEPAFGRQEVIKYKEREILVLLSKNPTGFNQSIEAVLENSKNPNVLLVLNDRAPDGRDVSWIWDIDIENLTEVSSNIFISGDRAYDMALRVKYSGNEKFETFENLKEAVESAVEQTKENETLFVLPTYSAMLEVRKILSGRKIL